MNQRLKELMIEAGYAAPELAGRAQRLADLLIRECSDIAAGERSGWEARKEIEKQLEDRNGNKEEI